MNTFGKNTKATSTIATATTTALTTMTANANMISAFDKQIQKWIELDNRLK